MAGFENFAAEAAQLDLELQRKGVALGIDWDNTVEVRALARGALNSKPAELDCGLADPENAARFELFGIAHLMLQVMEESAEEDIHTHGGPTWKAFARALWAEYEARKVGAASAGRFRPDGLPADGTAE
jgi:hypothetical protein